MAENRRVIVFLSRDGHAVHWVWKNRNPRDRQHWTLCGVLLPKWWRPLKQHHVRLAGLELLCPACIKESVEILNRMDKEQRDAETPVG